jgi:hypothetical protein
MKADKLPHRLMWMNKHAKRDSNAQEDDPTTVEHFLNLLPPPTFRDLVMATRKLGHPLPKEVVPVLDRQMVDQGSGVSRKAWKSLEKNGDAVLQLADSCPYCNGSGNVHGSTGMNYKCYSCSGRGTVSRWKYIGPVI